MIVGIDVGTTTGVALLDVNSDWYIVKSKKHWRLEDIATFILKYGEPILIATDVRKIPLKVKKISSILGAKIMKKNKDMKKCVKFKLVKSLKYTDSHQRDALSAALEAKKRLKPLLSKIDVKEKAEVLSMIIKHKKPNIQEAIKIIYENKFA